MKKFFAIYLLSLCMFPILANSTIASCSQTNGRPNCLSHGGCYFTEFEGCQECGSDQYHAKQLNCPANYEDETCTNSCETIPDGYFKTDDGSDIAQCPTTQIETYFDGVANIGNCSCTASTFLIQTNGNEYYCGQCGAGTPTTQGGITTCSCFTGTNHINGDILPQGNIRVECLCPGIVENGQCVCPLNKYLSQGTDGVYSCESCPEHSTSAVGSTNVNDCQCDSDFPKRILDENNKLIGCSACADNASFQDDSCQCTTGYYGDGTSSCTQCPIGTTTTIGATQRNECQMTSATKFCYGSGDNKKCMHLIPADTVIYAPNNT